MDLSGLFPYARLPQQQANADTSFMIFYLNLAIRACLSFGYHLMRSIPSEGWQHAWKRVLLFIPLWCGFVLLSALHLLGFLIDDILFHDYRQVRVRAPVFIIGIPRSGTTFLQRVLAHDETFSTFSTWEVLLAPSISERIFYSCLGRILTPFRRAGSWFGKTFLLKMDTIHTIRLTQPEEDFLLLFWIRACFLQAFLCPRSGDYWQLAEFDDTINNPRRRQIMCWYRSCLQRHLFFHGRHKTILSKNPSFTSLLGSLQSTFPDARFIACYRTPLEAVPSQLSAMRPIMRLLGGGSLDAFCQEKLLRILIRYYAILKHHHNDPALILVPMASLQTSLLSLTASLYRFLNKDMSQNFQTELAIMNEKARQYRSRHDYNLPEFGLNEITINDRFEPVWPVPAQTEPA